MTLRVEVIGDKIANVESCKCDTSYKNEIIKSSERKLTNRLKENFKKIWALRSKVTVEPFIICYILPSVLSGLAVQNLCLEKACLVNLKYDEKICYHIMRGHNHNYTEEEKNVQRMVTNMTAWSYPLQTALPGILSLFLGAWSDRTGKRKCLMVLPILGKIFSIFGIILSTVFFYQIGLNETALIEGLPPALAGGRVVLTMAVYSYITDITSESERTFRLGIITAILTLSRPLGLALSGVMIIRFGYYGVFTTAFVFYLAGFIYILLRLKEVPNKSVESDSNSTFLTLFSLSHFIATVNVGFKKRPGSQRLQLILILIIYILIVGPVLGKYLI